MSALWQDLRVAVRMLCRAPGVTLPALLVLALGVGAATALFSVVHAMWLRPLPYPEADRLVSVTTEFPSMKLDVLLSPDYGTWQGTRSLGPLAAYNVGTAALVGANDTVEVGYARVSGNLLGVLRVKAALGRLLQTGDDLPQAPRVAMLADGLWRHRFGGSPHAVGRTVRVDGELYTVVGVLPRGFRMPHERRVDILTPLVLTPELLRHGGQMKIWRGVGRIQDGYTLGQVRAEFLTKLAASRAQEPRLYQQDVVLRVVPLNEYAVRDVRTAALVLLGAVGSILLIACANVASLLVARAAGRTREMAVRAALGASGFRLARHLLVEGLLLAGLGAAGGLVLANVLVLALVWARPAALARVAEMTLNREVLGIALAAAVVVALVFSLAPVVARPRVGVRRLLVVAELGVSLVLLVGAALLLQSLGRLQAVDPGFRTEQLVTASLSLRGTRFENLPMTLRGELEARLQRTPGTFAVAFADALPPTDNGRMTTFSRADRPLPKPFHRGDNVLVRLVSASYLGTMGMPLRQGRNFTPAEAAGNGLVAIVNQSLADRYFPGESPLGKQVDGLGGMAWKTVVGVAADARNDGLRNPAQPEIILPLTDSNQAQGGGVTRDNGLNVVVRTAADPGATAAAVRGHLREMDRTLLAKVRSVDEQWAELTAAPRFQATTLSIFAALALVMAAAGVYGVLSHAVVLRQREIGVRMAVGARPVDVQRLVLREAALLGAAGVVLGMGGALATSRVLAGLLYGVAPQDPATLAGAAALLVALAVVASAVPAWRASQVDPVRTLRAE